MNSQVPNVHLFERRVLWEAFQEKDFDQGFKLEFKQELLALINYLDSHVHDPVLFLTDTK